MPYLTKSRFKIGTECPTKLYYHDRKLEYANSKADDPFLMALADGGFQVGELAKAYFPDGIDITTLNHQEALDWTNKELERDNVVLYEPAFLWNDCFIRVDILVKKGNILWLYEVKAKSCSSNDPEQFRGKRVAFSGGWVPYLEDVAFQTYVLRNAKPNYTVIPHLSMVDKSKYTVGDGLHQAFKLMNDRGRKSAYQVRQLTEGELANPILAHVPIDEIVTEILQGALKSRYMEMDFDAWVAYLRRGVLDGEKLYGSISTGCKGCEFRANKEAIANGNKCGFTACWTAQTTLTANELQEQMFFDIWRTRRKNDFFNANQFLMRDLDVALLGDNKPNKNGMSSIDRQTYQIEKVANNETSPVILKDDLKKEMSTWVFPYHFIDFETCQPAIPFHKGMRPYSGLAFQFSHHVMHEDGRVEHKSEFLNTEPGAFPNFEFVRAFKNALEHDSGTIFRYSAHENTYLNKIRQQLEASEELDKAELIAFIESIIKFKVGKDVFRGQRYMVDLLQVYNRYYYHPATGGSNSIKYVLPALLNECTWLQAKYSQPIYGTPTLPSLNFNNHTWITTTENGKVVNPYNTLPPVFNDITVEEQELNANNDELLADGGAAMTAYARIQFTDFPEAEREAIQQALLRYCELDTLAMVMIVEHFQQVVTA